MASAYGTPWIPKHWDGRYHGGGTDIKTPVAVGLVSDPTATGAPTHVGANHYSSDDLPTSTRAKATTLPPASANKSPTLLEGSLT